MEIMQPNSMYKDVDATFIIRKPKETDLTQHNTEQYTFLNFLPIQTAYTNNQISFN